MLVSVAGAAGDLASLEEVYNNEVQKIEGKYVLQAAQSMDTYEARLQDLEKQLAAKGDLNGVVAVQKEKQRFSENRAIVLPKEALVDKPAELKQLQAIMSGEQDRLNIVKGQEISNLTKKYTARLNALKTSLTKAMKIDEALAVQKEIERVAADIQEAPKVTTTKPIAEPRKKVKLKNIAPDAAISASSENNANCVAKNAADGVTDGSVGSIWASKGEGAGAWIEFRWEAKKDLHLVKIADRPNGTDKVLDATIRIGEKSIKTGPLPGNGDMKEFPVEPPAKASSLKIVITKADAKNVGLSEVEIFAE